MTYRWSETDLVIISERKQQPKTTVHKPQQFVMDTLLVHLQMARLLPPETEYKFHPTRKWRFDYAYVDQKIAIEREGGIWTQGRHTRGAGYENDIRKYNEAVVLGWRLLRFSTEMIENGEAVETLKRLLSAPAQ